MEILEHVALKDSLAEHIGDEAQLQKCLHYVFHSGQVLWAHVHTDSRIQNTNLAFRRTLGVPEDFHGISLYDYLAPVNENTLLCGGFGDQPGLPTVFHSKVLATDLLFMVYDYEDGYILLGQVNQPDTERQSALLADLTAEMGHLIHEIKQMNLDLTKANKQITKIAQVDELTGLANHRYLFQRFDEDLAYANRYHTPLTVVSFDLDNFKQINEHYGRLVGDTVLKQVGTILQSLCRASDLPARYGGEKFCIVLPHASQSDAIQFAERVRTTIEQCQIESEPALKITASFGLVENHNLPSIQSMLSLAEKALTEAKTRGKNKVCVYSCSQGA